MKSTIQHPKVHRRFRRTYLIDGCSVRVSEQSSIIEGRDTALVAYKLPVWLKDGMTVGSWPGTWRRYPE